MSKLYIIIPAYNEEENIETVARQWHAIVEKISNNSRLVIIDDGSNDETYAKLCALKNELPQLEPITKPNGGHGATIYYGYNHALNQGAGYVFQTDGDGQTLPDEFDVFWENRENYDIQIGFRKSRQDGFSRVFVTKVLKLVLFLQFGMWIKDANTPYRLMSAATLAQILPKIPKEHNLTNVLMTVLYRKDEKQMQYHPITFRPRQGGVNSINFAKIVKIGKKAFKDFGSLKKDLR